MLALSHLRCRYGNATLPILNTTAGIVDTGTTLLYIATEAFQAYTAATGASLDAATGLLKVANPDSLQSLFFHMSNVSSMPTLLIK
jgi:Eukaryotic aspartyl protease